ncbi:hypothetical protein DFJ58DRAFT_728967 [Suillus subalutaceus]|uniref:uncharacterized protein n=1 Tax=Suillus subalutaceus TaxID=48586 RepID=UPI001B86F3C3|nr:uncharacterized protein DFJ58DRAFT_728967 [Suillus subalutaceus]KAG1851311.1 hypothetical protein DFJ58DRAFT_728967 [Suillus subalutaceus]
MPLRIANSAPRFAGDGTQLVNFLESVERLAQPLGLSDKEIIKYALKYTAPKHRQLLSYRAFDNYVEFADHVLDFWPECGVCHYTRPIFEKPAAIEAPLASAPPHPERAQEQPEAAIIAPIPETYDTSLPHAPNQVPPAAPELQYATPVDQSTPLDDPITDETALFNDSSSCSSTNVQVVHQMHHMDHVPDDQDAYLDHARTTPEETLKCANGLYECSSVNAIYGCYTSKALKEQSAYCHVAALAYQAVQDNVLDDPHAFSLSAQCAFDIWKFRVFVTDTVLILAPVTSYLPLKRSHIGLDSPPTLTLHLPLSAFKYLAADYRQPDVHARTPDALHVLSDPTTPHLPTTRYLSLSIASGHYQYPSRSALSLLSVPVSVFYTCALLALPSRAPRTFALHFPARAFSAFLALSPSHSPGLFSIIPWILAFLASPLGSNVLAFCSIAARQS